MSKPNSNPSPTTPSTASDAELLRKFEPVVRYTRGEQFYAMDVERYIRAEPWVRNPDGTENAVVDSGQPTLNSLIEPRTADFGAVQYLKFVSPMNLAESAKRIRRCGPLTARKPERVSSGAGTPGTRRNAAGVADAGSFPEPCFCVVGCRGATAAAAAVTYAEMQKGEEKYEYHGRVVCQNGWTILQGPVLYGVQIWLALGL